MLNSLSNTLGARHLPVSVTVLLAVSLVPWLDCSWAHEPVPVGRGQLANREPDQSLNADEEAFIHTPVGFKQAGKPAIVSKQDAQAATLRVTIVEVSSGKPTACRVNVVGSRGNYYEPEQHLLAPWSRQQTAQQETHGPSRYYGWYFYTLGQFEVLVPAGKVRVEVHKGFEFLPVEEEISVVAGETRNLQIRLKRTAPMQEHGYYSGDIHIHLNRHHDEDLQRALDLMAAEDIEFGFLLCMNSPETYSGVMKRQDWQQLQGFGNSSVRTRGRYGVASGQEYRAMTYGHICLLMHDEMVWNGATVDPNRWPTFAHVGHETRRLGGVSFHAHGGYSAEIYADYIEQATDGVELLQMAHYRGIGLSGWYRILNCGFRFPGLAGSDFPYNRCLGDCRNYVYAQRRPDFKGWTTAAREGRSFFTTGPLVLLDVNGSRPGDTIDLATGQSGSLNVTVRVRSEITPVEHVELIVGGETVRSVVVPNKTGRGHWYELKHRLKIDQPTWIAARAFSVSPTGRPDAEAHTNPVYVYVDRKKPFDQEDRDWLLAKLDGRIALLEQREFTEKPQVMQVFQAARQKLLER
jgi:hypothetical protein